MKSVLRIILLFFISISAFSQGLCDLPSGAEKGDFDVTPVACIGQKIEVIDKSGGTDIKYIFRYTGQSASALSSVPSLSGPNAEWAFAASGNFIILQYGKKNGKDMYACKVVTIRDSNKPDISYEACNNENIRLTIRDTPANNFTSYKIKWGDGTENNITGTITLPYTVQKRFSSASSQNVLVEGYGSSITNCPAATPITIKMDRGEMFPRIEKIELNEEGTEATITLNGNPDAEYEIFTRTKDRAGSLANPLPNKVKAGTFTLPVQDKTKSQCFFVGRYGALCQEYSNEVCTMPFTLEALEEDNRITWQTFTTGLVTGSAVWTHIESFQTEIVRETEGEANPVVFNNPTSPFLDNTADCGKKYCYTLSTKVISSYAGYSGSAYQETATVLQIKCIDRKDIKPDALTETVVTVKDNNTIGIEFIDNSSWKLDINRYRLYRIDNNEPNKIDSIASASVKVFSDTLANPDEKSYCYAIDFIDKCGSTSALSPVFCSIFLSEADKNDLMWTGETPFGNGDVGSYEVESFDENTNQSSVDASLPATQLTYTPDLGKFEEEAKFRIKAIGPGNKESFSNIYIIPLTVKLFLPEAFSPNSDAINDNLELKGTFKRIVNFDFQIYNRWGNPVFTSDDPLKSWDGSFQGVLAPVDTYTYQIYAKLKDGTEVKKSGKFVLMR